MTSRNSFKFVMLPPQTETTRGWARRLAEAVPEVRVVVAEDADTAAREIVDAEAAFGWLGKDHADLRHRFGQAPGPTAGRVGLRRQHDELEGIPADHGRSSLVTRWMGEPIREFGSISLLLYHPGE